jgi:hypothetical protein
VVQDNRWDGGFLNSLSQVAQESPISQQLSWPRTGFCPDDLGAAPAEVVRFLADQLKVPPEGLSAYGRRAQARTDHFLAVQDHLGYRKAGPEERERLARWLLDRALEHDRPLLLWQLACEKLASEKVVRPGVTVLERMVIAARRDAERETMKRLAAVLDEPGGERSLIACSSPTNRRIGPS